MSPDFYLRIYLVVERCCQDIKESSEFETRVWQTAPDNAANSLRVQRIDKLPDPHQGRLAASQGRVRDARGSLSPLTHAR